VGRSTYPPPGPPVPPRGLRDPGDDLVYSLAVKFAVGADKW